MRGLLKMVVAGAVLLSGCSHNGDGGTGGSSEPSSFNIAIIPDTQFYSENNKRGFLNLDPRYPGLGYEPALAFYAQTAWLAQNEKAMRLAFTVQVGDLVQNGGEYQREWDVASKAMKTLEDNAVDYGAAPGNHDVRDKTQFDNERRHSIEGYLKNFGVERARTQNGATLVERDPLGYSEARSFSALGQEFLVLSMDWKPSDATLAWAQGVLDKYPRLPTIITSHNILDVDAEGNTILTGDNGQRLWDVLINRNDQVFMTLSGHNHHSSRLTRQNGKGHSVEMILVDYQDEYAGGNGLMRLLELDFARNTVQAFTFSPWVLEKITDPAKKGYYKPCATPEVTSDCDQLMPEPNIGNGAHYDNRYTFSLDFRARFASFGGYTARPGAAGKPLVDELKDKLAAIKAGA
ncbi:MAG TPA: metallophosphoesterase [Solimonas sp.]